MDQGNSNDKSPSLYLTRHGHTAFNASSQTGADADAGGGRIRGWIDLPLDREGMDEAKFTADRLHQILGGDLRLPIVSSDMNRAIQTAGEISTKFLRPLTKTTALRPWHLGSLQGTDAAEAHKILSDYALNRPDTPVPMGESFNDFKRRCLNCLRQLMTDMDDEGESKIAVAHYRNLRLAGGWLDNGATDDYVNVPKFLERGSDQTGEILRIFRNADGRTWGVELL